MQWGDETALSVATGGVPCEQHGYHLTRAEQARQMLDAVQRSLEERKYPFSCADLVENHVDRREDGKVPDVRVSRASRCPCLIVSINGGRFFREGVATSKSVTKVVCTVSLGTNSGKTLAATLGEEGSWESCTAFTFTLDITQLQRKKEDSVLMKAPQSLLAMSCSVLDENGVQNVIGRVKFDLMAILRLAVQNGGETVAYLLDDANQHICMRDNHGNMQRTCIYFSVDGYRLPAWISDSAVDTWAVDAWAPASLDDFLKTVGEAAPSAAALKSADADARNQIFTQREATDDSEEGDDDLSQENIHWRERLERIMDSLWMSFCVVVLVLIDIVLAIVFEFGDKNLSSMPTGVIAVQSLILIGFVLELSFRYVAKRRRF